MALPQHPAARLARRHFVFAAVFFAIAGLMFWLGATTAWVVALIGSGFMAWAGFITQRSARSVLLNNVAYERLTRGRVEEAEALLAQIAPSAAAKGAVARSMSVQRAMIALYRGDAARAVGEATFGLSAPYGMFARDHQLTQDAGAHAVRALARASLGQDAEALADAERAENAELTTPEAMARAKLARALVASRKEGAAGLSAVFAGGGGARMIEYLAPRERVLARALRRMAYAPRPHAYREAGKRDDTGEAKEVAAWVAKLAPAAAEYAAEMHATAGEVETRVAPTPEARAAVARTRAAPVPGAPSRGRLMLVLWLVLLGLFAGIWFALAPSSSAPGRPSAPYVAPWWISSWAVGGLMVVAIAASVALQLRRQRTISRAFARMRLDVARGDEARAEATLRPLTNAHHHGVAGNAWLGLAQIAERRGDFARALEACGAGLWRLSQTAAVQAMQADLALPEIIATRAFALAALGRTAEAEAERARLAEDCPSYPFAGRAHLRVALVSALRAGDLEGAAKVARARPSDMPLAFRDDILADVVLSVVDGASPDELARIEAELKDDEKVRAWVDAVAPGLREKMRGRATLVRVVEDEAHAAEDAEPFAEEDHAAPAPLRAKAAT